VLFYNAGGQIAKGIDTNQVQYMLYQIDQFWMAPGTMACSPVWNV
jgi:hypothetical protein